MNCHPGWQFRYFRLPNRPPKDGRRPKNERLRVGDELGDDLGHDLGGQKILLNCHRVQYSTVHVLQFVTISVVTVTEKDCIKIPTQGRLTSVSRSGPLKSHPFANPLDLAPHRRASTGLCTLEHCGSGMSYAERWN